ncbi:DNA polymerase III subunit gamma/tau [Paracoccus salsus]|uniref:DNA polymerase III subunit gamma/tau n=1 Tax=Paracoccus salsus TaxID=2911061 RepID=UPI001F340B36|nr:DNA polymerase III subunit gamma/tau [Paracoccus salsus]
MSETQQVYQVLARKYRPETFGDLVGQDPMVRTLKNAFAADRIAQAFIMTGIRGTGKTTTARIIAKGMNCIGADGQGGPTTQPCGTCEHCIAISEGRHVDVMEMDAASRTGVNDIREIIESVHYRAASARFKIYIIDEVHMLSTSAFNALLKTLEEPPPHVKFIFATTEIRKVPVTVLSRCQRFDLRRIEPEVMIALLRRIASAENAQITDDALALITRAAEGSARDATSLLDQAISHGAGETGADQVRAMLGLADRGRVIDLFEMILRGDAAAALTELQSQYADGADPVAVLRDLAEITHWISVVKITPEAIDDPTISPDERLRGQSLAERLAMRVLTRLWQMLLKALDEVSAAPNAMMAAEMAIIRLTHVADLPDPGALIRKVQQSQAAGEFSRQSAPSHGGQQAPQAVARTALPVSPQRSGAATALALSPDAFAAFPDFASVLDLIRRMGDMLLLVQVENHVALVRYSPGRIEFEPRANAPADLAQRLGERLRGWCGGQRWAVTVSNGGGALTIAQQRDVEMEKARKRALDLPIVQQVLASFPQARLKKVSRIVTDPDIPESIAAEGAANPHDTKGPLAEVEEWDPFEDED